MVLQFGVQTLRLTCKCNQQPLCQLHFEAQWSTWITLFFNQYANFDFIVIEVFGVKFFVLFSSSYMYKTFNLFYFQIVNPVFMWFDFFREVFFCGKRSREMSLLGIKECAIICSFTKRSAAVFYIVFLTFLLLKSLHSREKQTKKKEDEECDKGQKSCL